ncbi:MAG: NAD+ synthase [Clostridiales bacterium]|jgi:NAD+ synthase|nr:NAD+ synthase [Clostridiales bacterium]
MYGELSQKLVEWIQVKVMDAGARGCVLGISGGVDSAVVAFLCNRALHGNVLGLHMPCYSSPQDTADARLIAEKLDINYAEINLEKAYDCIMETFMDLRKSQGMHEFEANYPIARDVEKLAANNIKPRLRMITLYYYARLYNYIVVGTGNRSELEVGYFTKYGDGGADILPLGGLVKTQVWQLAKFLGVPNEIINKPPSAGLWAGQTDEGELGITYKQLDRIILTGCGDPKVIEGVNRLRVVNSHKMRMPAIPDISFNHLNGEL